MSDEEAFRSGRLHWHTDDTAAAVLRSVYMMLQRVSFDLGIGVDASSEGYIDFKLYIFV